MTKYMEIYENIKFKILTGTYASWSSLESEDFLSKSYNVSRPTIRKAISELKTDGFVHSRQGSGIFVNPPEFYNSKNLTSISERTLDTSIIRNEIIDFYIGPIENEIAKLFNADSSDNFIKYTRLRLVNELPSILEITYMPKSLFNDFTKDILYGSVFKYIENHHGYTVSHDTQKIKAIKINDTHADILKIDPNSLTLEIEHKVYLTRSILAQYTLEILCDNSYSIASVR